MKDEKFARVSKISHLILETLVHVRIRAPILEQDDPRIIAIRRLLGFKTKEFRQINI